MNRSVGNYEILLILFELELARVNLHVKEKQLLVSSRHAELVLSYSLAS